MLRKRPDAEVRPHKRSRLVLPKKEYKALLLSVFDRDNWRCRMPSCGRRSNLHAHHIIFRSHGGDDAEWNLITLCSTCHDAVHDRWLLLEGDATTGVTFTPING